MGLTIKVALFIGASFVVAKLFFSPLFEPVQISVHATLSNRTSHVSDKQRELETALISQDNNKQAVYDELHSRRQ